MLGNVAEDQRASRSFLSHSRPSERETRGLSSQEKYLGPQIADGTDEDDENSALA